MNIGCKGRILVQRMFPLRTPITGDAESDWLVYDRREVTGLTLPPYSLSRSHCAVFQCLLLHNTPDLAGNIMGEWCSIGWRMSTKPVGATCGRPLPQRAWPGAAVARQAVLPSGTSGSGRETLVKSGLARRSVEVPTQGFVRRGYIRGGQPLMRTLSPISLA